MQSKSYIFALAVVFITVAGLLGMGLHVLTSPRIFLIHHSSFAYEGPIFIGIAALLAWFRQWVAQKLARLFMELYWTTSAFTVSAIIGTEGFLHFFNIPHVEGWWIPIVGGGATVTAGALARKWHKKNSKTLYSESACNLSCQQSHEPSGNNTIAPQK